MRNKLLKDDQENMKEWEGHINIYYFIYKYIYGIPLCYQTFPVTESSKNWGEEYGYFVKTLCSFGFKMTELFNMDKNPEPGFTICYIVSKCLFLFLFLFVCYFGFLHIFSKTVPNFTETAIIENKITFDETK
jgi:amino acid permease